MSKLIKRGDEARKALEAGVNSLADHPGSQGPERGSGQEVRRSPHHQ